ncbi:MAG: 30S ribosomal protein S8 [Rickettsiales bacterium]|jgi:small subunit ribosomal protein S8|nr:30S ribosomal protein S8 [Rickettsiales bacterium]
MFNHSVSDLVARIKNGCLAKKTKISSPYSIIRESILKILKDEGYISNYTKLSTDKGDILEIHLKYLNYNSVINEIEVVSKPGRRYYCSSKNIPIVKNGLGVVLISTHRGLVTDHQARVDNIGGEVLLKIF